MEDERLPNLFSLYIVKLPENLSRTSFFAKKTKEVKESSCFLRIIGIQHCIIRYNEAKININHSTVKVFLGVGRIVSERGETINCFLVRDVFGTSLT